MAPSGSKARAAAGKLEAVADAAGLALGAREDKLVAAPGADELEGGVTGGKLAFTAADPLAPAAPGLPAMPAEAAAAEALLDLKPEALA